MTETRETSLYRITYQGNSVVTLGSAGIFQSGTSAWVSAAQAEAARNAGDFVVEGFGAGESATKPLVATTTHCEAPQTPPGAASNPPSTPTTSSAAAPTSEQVAATPVTAKPAPIVAAAPTAVQLATKADTEPVKPASKDNGEAGSSTSIITRPPGTAPRVGRRWRRGIQPS